MATVEDTLTKVERAKTAMARFQAQAGSALLRVNELSIQYASDAKEAAIQVATPKNLKIFRALAPADNG